MKLLISALIAIVNLNGANRYDQLEADLNRIRAELEIPALRVAIADTGRIVWRKNLGSGPSFEPASITEIAVAEAIQRLAGQGRLSLDDPVAKYSPDSNLPAGATIRHVLSHTADGTPGEEFVRNDELFGALESVVENVSGKPSMRPAASIGDLAKFHAPSVPLGWNNQTYSGERIVWNFGQTDRASSLFISLPDRKLAFIVLASSKALTESARLENGNIARSRVALAFLENVVHSSPSAKDQLQDRAMEAFYAGKRDSSAAMLRDALKRYPEMDSTCDVSLLVLFSQLAFPETEACATAVLAEHRSLPLAWFYYAKYLENQRRFREAAASFEQITEHKPPWHHWTVLEAKKELATLQ